MADEIETIGLVVRGVMMFQIPPRTSNKGYKADTWGTDKPTWIGVLRVVSKGSKCFIRLVDKTTGDLFAQCPVDAFPGIAVEPVLDSSRYFVLRVLDEGSGQHAFIGIGFSERTDAFDFNVALGDHFKHEKAAAEASKPEEPYVPKHATGGLAGPIKINIKKKGGTDKEKKATPTVSLGAGFGGLAAPSNLWGASGAPPPPTAAASNPFAAPAASANPFAAPAAASSTNPFATAPAPTQASGSGDDWGDFSSGGGNSGAAGNTGGDWVKF
eukprot:m.108028 g.108028  ORF g.108028 m.108028 type:complete len:270 (+) comp16942_c0_seq1:146-955(+)